MMRMVRYRATMMVGYVLLTVLATGITINADQFPVPDAIKENVAFWKKIYTEVSLSEGLIHDRDYPLIIYEKISVRGKSTAQQTAYIEAKKKQYAQIIRALRDSAVAPRNPLEQKVKSLHSAYPASLSGAEERLRFQLGQKERFRAGLERSTIWLDTISAILSRQDMPQRLKYLPHVESSFDPEAYSRVGAAGIWQFMRSTGKQFLRIDYTIDERLDPVKSTVAATRLLKMNYSHLQSWALAITAYNHGLSGMKRAVTSTGSNDIAVILQKHESPSFKFASKNFYACFIAASDLADSAALYFPNLTRHPPFKATTFRLPSSTTPSTLLRRLNISEKEFRQLNPSFRPVLFKQQRPIPAGYVVNVPGGTQTTIVASAENVPAKTGTPVRKTPEPQQPLQHNGYYTIVRGDNLQSIARRFGISVRELARLNALEHLNRIYEGQVLRMPTADLKDIATVSVADTTTTADTATSTLSTVATAQTPTTLAAVTVTPLVPTAPDSVAVSTKQSAPSPSVASLAPSGTTAQASASTPSEIAPHVPDADIPATPDGISSATVVKPAEPATGTDHPAAASTTVPPTDSASGLQAGVIAQVAAAAPDSFPPVERQTQFDASAYELDMQIASGATSAVIHVAADETIGHFADWLNVSTKAIMRLNNLQTPQLRFGQRVVLPLTPRGDVKQFAEARLEYHMALEEDFYSRYEVRSIEQYTLRKNETLWRVCSREQIPLWLLKKHNRHIDFTGPRPGATLFVPRTVARSTHVPPVLTDAESDTVPILQNEPEGVGLPTYPEE